MSVKMLVFDYRETENEFFKKNPLENFDVTFYTESLNQETLKNISQEELDNTAIVSVFVNSNITREVIDAFKNLRMVSTRSTGYDHIDKDACIDKNIALLNVENYGSTTVAQYAFSLVMALVRNLIPAVDYVKKQDDAPKDFVGRDLSRLNLGVVGTGAIGSSVCKFAHSFGMKIFAYDMMKKQELIDNFNVEYVEFHDLIKQSDVITIHVPYTGNNYHMFSEREFNLMRPESFFVNTSRGELIDAKNLYRVLKDGKLKGAALDVLACENICYNCFDFSKNLENASLECIEQMQATKKLAEFENVLITPHIAYNTQDSINYILQKTIEGIRDTIKGGSKYRVV